jgi:uncharacterized protein with FMN-binding domain
MKRAPIVAAGTVAGVVLVLTFHTSPAAVTIPGGTASSTTQGQRAGKPDGASGRTTGHKSARNRSGGTPAPSQHPAGERSAVGPVVNYDYGLISVRVSVSGKKITKVSIASLNDGSNPRSQMIDQQSIPQLEQEALQAQSANIQGVSGASYTSAGFVQSLQGALRSLGV